MSTDVKAARMLDDDSDRLFKEAIEWMKVNAIPLTVRWQLAYRLDNRLGHADWKMLAETRGLEYLKIRSIEDRVCYTTHKSCTLFLFEEHLDKMNLTVSQLIDSLSKIGNEACVSVFRKAFDDGSLSAVVKDTEHILYDRQRSNVSPACERCYTAPEMEDRRCLSLQSPGSIKGAKKVFIAYSKDANELAHNAYKWLKKNRIEVFLDLVEHRLLRENRFEWYDTKYSEADYILLLISPHYQRDIGRKDNDDETVQSTCYINNRMQAEYWRNKCINKRFILVFLPGAKSRHAPVWLQNVTLSYWWPDHCCAIVERIKDYPRSRPTAKQSLPVVVTSRT